MNKTPDIFEDVLVLKFVRPLIVSFHPQPVKQGFWNEIVFQPHVQTDNVVVDIPEQERPENDTECGGYIRNNNCAHI